VICLTFDTDWMTDESLGRFLDEFPLPGRATFFCHDVFPCLERTRHELCPHPFIRDLSDWQAGLTDLTSRLGRRARGVRPHSCVFSHMIGVGLHDLGFEYVSQAHSMYQSGLTPFRHPWGVWELPIYYMDNMDFWMRTNWPSLGHEPFSREWIDRSLNDPGLYVFDFHPLHIALNTSSADDYQRVKARIIDDHVSPFDLTFPGRGAREYFVELCEALAGRGVNSHACFEAVDQSADIAGTAMARGVRS
jgi:hypothetical protein